MKSIEVVAAIIKKENKILATKRGYGEFINMWVFTGGKIESGETNEAALIREIKEELDADIKIDEFALTVEYTYPTFHLTMHCYICSLKDTITLLEHNDAKWLEKNEFNAVNWLPADIEVIDFLKNYL